MIEIMHRGGGAGVIGEPAQAGTRPAHQRTPAQEHDIVPEDVPVLSCGLPITRPITRDVGPERYVGLCQLLPDRVDQQPDTAFRPGEARVENQIDEACKRSCRHAALAAVKALPRGPRYLSQLPW